MPEPNFRNRTLFHGDNLKFLQAINSGTVHLIATDPPFNKGRDFHATPDSLAAGGKFEDRWRYDKDVHPEWIDAIKDDNPAVWSVIDTANEIYKKRGKQKEDGSDMGAFLCYMGVRLMEMHRVLRDDGSLYLHADHTASHYLKAMLDAIFGRGNFRNEIVWAYTGPSNTHNHFPRKHDVILFYAKSKKTPFNRDEVRVPYAASSVARSKYGGEPTDGMGFSSRQINEEGKIIEDWWIDISMVRNIKAENYGYKTQKPLKLYERIIKASSNEDDIVLDPFAGCATTVVAAERLHRRWIGIDFWNGAMMAVVVRLVGAGVMDVASVKNDILTEVCARVSEENLDVSKLPTDIRAEIAVRFADGRLAPDTVPDSLRRGMAHKEKSQQRLLAYGEVHYTTKPPERTDNRAIAAPAFEVPPEYQKAEWERLSHAEIRAYLKGAQADGENVICAGCGRRLHPRFMELDHINPRASGGANTIDNRVLLCRPCNGEKKADLAIPGLWKKNAKDKWMEEPDAAQMAFNAARDMAERVRRGFR